MVVWPDRHTGTMGSPEADEAILEDVRGSLAAGRVATLHYGPDGQRRGEGMDVFVNALDPPPRMLVFGAIDFAAAMARMGVFLGYHVTVCDARPVFATKSRFPDAHEVVVNWPHRYLKTEAEAGRIDPRTVITVLTHDPKFDVPVLVEALKLDLAYVGAMGSRKTHNDRARRLREAGVTDEQMKKIASPIGLDLGARTPEETAVSIAAEVISLRWGGGATRTRLADAEGPIHGAHPIAHPEPIKA
jgi:xanthine dehydrogenase accessory factor